MCKSIDKQLRRFPDKIRRQFLVVIAQYQGGELRPRRLHRGDCFVINVGLNYRIVIRNDKLLCMSHEAYNRYVNSA